MLETRVLTIRLLVRCPHWAHRCCVIFEKYTSHKQPKVSHSSYACPGCRKIATKLRVGVAERRLANVAEKRGASTAF